MFHLTTHAFFKALLFLGAGSVIHAMSGEQNILNMGGLKNKIKTTHITFLLGTLAIIGFPLFSGFFSKDEILEKLFNHSPIVWGFALVSAAITIIYMLRMYILTFWGDFRGSKEQESHLHESPATMTIPLIVLAILSVFGGLLNLPHLIGEKSQHLAHWYSKINSLKALPAHESHLSPATEWLLMGIAVALVLILGFFSFNYFTKNKVDKTHVNKGFALWGEHKFYVDEFYQWMFVRPFEVISNILYQFVEQSLIQPIIFGSTRIFNSLGQMMKLFQNGNVEYYLLYMAMGSLILLTFLMYIFK
jgi:NADH-quinone oxidoreductase subunit L